MPELPEVETVARGIAPHILKKNIERVEILNPNLRWPVPHSLIENLENDCIHTVSRRGKYLLFYTKKGCIIAHLGMSGSFYITHCDTPLKKHDHVLFTLASNKMLRYHDPRRFGSILWTETSPFSHKLLSKLGPEPLSVDFHAEYLYNRCQKSQRAIKVFIMDACVVVGVGNIYACEALFDSRIHPCLPANQLSLTQCERLTDAIRKLLHAAISSGGTTLRDFVNPDSKPGYFKQSLQVYGRQQSPCQDCHTLIEVIKLGQRSSFFCPSCQENHHT